MAFNANGPVDDLIAAGRYAEAAAAALAGGDAARAADLYERIWDFAAAARAARQAGDLPRALRAALDDNDQAQVDELIEALAHDEASAHAALVVLEKKRRLADAGRLAERLGETARAAELFRAGHRELDAARLLHQLGHDREAGLLYERVIARGDGDEVAAAHLRLGELLAQRLQHDAAIPHLQAATAAATTRAAARPLLVVELAALGLADAARDVLLAARVDDPGLPASVEAVVAAHRPATRRAADADLIAGRYRLDKLLGAGATGRVHRARDEVSGREIALKVLTATGQGSPAWERFAREARVASALRHANLVEVLDFSAEHGYLAMELMIGGSLEARLGEPLPAAQARRIGLDVLGGLELAHQRGIIHRDIKPANVFFDARGTAKLGDFGVAHLLDLGQTQTGGLIGTLAYMSPEQITGAPLTVAADLYAFGVTLFEMLAGRPPFLGPDFVAQHLGEPAPTLASLIGEAASSWDPILTRLLAKDPDARPATASQVAHELAALDLGARTPTALVLPRARPWRPSTQAAAVGAPSTEPRYLHETAIGTTPISTLARALDRTLDRSVLIERFDEGAPDEATAHRLLALARSSSPFFQRVLSFDRATRVVVFEAPAGTPVADLLATGHGLDSRTLGRLFKRLARALAALHDRGNVHGALGPMTVLVDELGNPSILASGLGAAPTDASPATDVAAIISVIAALAGTAPTAAATLTALAAGLDAAGRERILGLPGPRHGEELFAFADALEIGQLRAARRSPA